MKYSFLGILVILQSCSRTNNDEVVLTNTSAFGSLVHIATFNGNSASKIEDCNIIKELLTKKYNRAYSCQKYIDIKKKIDK